MAIDEKQQMLLSHAWLRGYLTTDDKALPMPTQYVDEKDEELNRLSLARILFMGTPPLEVCKALAEVPTNVFTRRFCFKALKNSSICHRSL